MNAADYAAQSDPDRNRNFRRAWDERDDAPLDHTPQGDTPEEIGTALVLAWRSDVGLAHCRLGSPENPERQRRLAAARPATILAAAADGA